MVHVKQEVIKVTEETLVTVGEKDRTWKIVTAWRQTFDPDKSLKVTGAVCDACVQYYTLRSVSDTFARSDETENFFFLRWK